MLPNVGEDPSGLEIAPSPPPSSRATWWSAWWPAVLVAAAGTAVLRLVTEWIALVGTYGVKFPHVVGRHPSVLVDIWRRWDATYYLSIAQHGYAGRVVRPGQQAGSIAFGPAYPWSIRAVHEVTGLGWIAAAEFVSLIATFVGVALVYRLAQCDGRGAGDEGGRRLAGTAVALLLAWPAAFFLLAPYPESMALALGAGAYLAARRRHWLLAGLLCAGTAMAKYYLVLLVLPLLIEVWEAQRQRGAGRRTREWWCWVAVAGPTVIVFGAWMLYQQVHLGDAVAFERAQAIVWGRHLAGPWSSLWHAIDDFAHLQFLDTSRASVVELFDFVSVVLVAVAAVVAGRRIRRSYAVLLGLAWCVFTFQTFLMGEVREVLALSPFWVAAGWWTTGHPWRERVIFALFLPCAYFLVQRFVTGAFAG